MGLKRLILQFGLLATALILLLELSKYSLITHEWRHELTVLALGGGFVALGIVIGRFVLDRKQKTVAPSPLPQPSFSPPIQQLKSLGISRREYEVLQEISLGKSNQEIADSLSISENTVKTHVSNLLSKLEAKRRTQAVSLAKQQGLLP